MNDMRDVIIPKSDQLNSDDLIGGPRTITITAVAIRPGTEQPVSIGFDGDGGKPWKPCKSMSRVLVSMWGPDAKQYTGRSLTLYRDPDVTWAGMKVGGIRISHMSDIERDHTMALTVTKQSRKPFTVKPLRVKAEPKPEPVRHNPETGEIEDDGTGIDQQLCEQTEPGATRAAGDDPKREWTTADAEKRGKEIAAVLRDHGDSAANLSYSWQQHADEIMSMPGPAQRGLRKVYETEMAAIENAIRGAAEPEEKDERQGDLV